MAALTESFWRGRPVFVTGHTGFKGGWLVSWLLAMGARVTGYALAPDTTPSYFGLCGLDRKMTSIFGDILDQPALERALKACAPDVLFHLAAQPLVRRAYREPAATFAVNVMGTVNVLEAARQVDSIRAIILVTSDKCYYPEPTSNGYEERDRLGGFDPYSSSKACAEMVTLAYSRSFFARSDRPVAAATVRAGNVIGGGDWAADRIVPDAIRALERGEPLKVRSPQAIRPWQHVLEPLVGYLVLAERLFAEGGKWTGAWNFGPAPGTELTVGEIADLVITHWGSGSRLNTEELASPPETDRLRLNSRKACDQLGWTSRLSVNEAVRLTVQWYRAARSEGSSVAYSTSIEQIHSYERLLVATDRGQQDATAVSHSETLVRR
jgi:CDP-glucose 4,6-dehydratase